MTKIITFIKPKIMQVFFLQYQILKPQEHINFAITYIKLLKSANFYCNFHILLMYYTFHCVLSHCTLHFALSFLLITLKSSCCASSDSSLFGKRSIIGQFNTQVATAEYEEQYTLSNTLYIAFENCYSFL